MKIKLIKTTQKKFFNSLIRCLLCYLKDIHSKVFFFINFITLPPNKEPAPVLKAGRIFLFRRGEGEGVRLKYIY